MSILLKELPDRDPPRPEDNVRALLITGGHDHETSFYSLFDGYKDLGRIVDQNDMTTGNSILVKSRLGEMSVLGMFPIGRFVPYLRGGAYYAHNAMESNMIAAATGDQANWTVGAGLRFDVTKWLAVRAEWQRYNNVGHANVGVRTDVETSTLGVLLRF